MQNGILVAGSTFVDHYKFIDNYPKLGMLEQIKYIDKTVGGLVSNTGISLKNISKDLRVGAFGGIGQDEDGDFLKDTLVTNGIDISQLVEFSEQKTGFTDAMTLEATGERTFFSHEGANTILDASHLNFDQLDYDIAHFGYILLMRQFDKPNEQYGTELAKVLCRLQEQGIKTSIDLVSNESPHFKATVHPALKYCNYVIINEIEAELITDLSPLDPDTDQINNDRIQNIMQRIFELGVQDLIVIHSPAGGWAMDRDGNFYHRKSFDLPPGYIKSSVGAGDAFCAGVLYGIYKQFDINHMLDFANATAAMSLSEKDSASGIQPEEEIVAFINKQGKER